MKTHICHPIHAIQCALEEAPPDFDYHHYFIEFECHLGFFQYTIGIRWQPEGHLPLHAS